MSNLESRFVTKCPFCESQFILTINQIRQIRDKISCSKCKKIYSLKGNLSPYILGEKKNTLKNQNSPKTSKNSAIGNFSKNFNPAFKNNFQFNYDSFDIEDISRLDSRSSSTYKRKIKKNIISKRRLKNIIPDYFDLDNYTINKNQFNILEDNIFLEEENVSFLEKFTLSYFLSFLALLMIFFQFIYYNFDILREDEDWNFFLKPFCSMNLCNLEKIDLNKIVLNNIQARLNSDGSWQIHALLLNVAKYRQPFPLLEMIFKDIRGNAISSLYIYPKQYVNGEMSGESIMPYDVSVHISFKVRPPKGKIAGYQFILRYIKEDK